MNNEVSKSKDENCRHLDGIQTKLDYPKNGKDWVIE